MSSNNTVKLGTFMVSSGKLVVTDPCYERSLISTQRCGGIIPVKNGTYHAYVVTSNEDALGDRNSHLLVVHEDHVEGHNHERCVYSVPFIVNVDSAQAGFFDEGAYPQGDSTGEYGDITTFYGRACNVEDAGIVDGIGAKATSGFGDGSYQCFTCKEDDVIVGACIVFIHDDRWFEDEDDDEELDDDRWFEEEKDDDEE